MNKAEIKSFFDDMFNLNEELLQETAERSERARIYADYIFVVVISLLSENKIDSEKLSNSKRARVSNIYERASAEDLKYIDIENSYALYLLIICLDPVHALEHTREGLPTAKPIDPNFAISAARYIGELPVAYLALETMRISIIWTSYLLLGKSAEAKQVASVLFSKEKCDSLSLAIFLPLNVLKRIDNPTLIAVALNQMAPISECNETIYKRVVKLLTE